MSEENQNQPNTDYRAEHMVGMPKSGMPWKKHSKKNSSRIKHFHTLTWEEKQKIKSQKKELKVYMDEIKAEQDAIVQKERQRLKDKKKRDELNKYKNADMQVITDSKKIKKWTKKARSTLVKLPSEIFEKLLAKKRM